MKEQKKPGKVFLIPSIIADDTSQKVISPQIIDVIKEIDYYLVEDLRTARRFISSLKTGKVIETIEFNILNKKTSESELYDFLEPVVKGKDVGIISDAGCPGIADPGAIVVKYAHRKNIPVVPLVGPSSILLALMASGFNGQSFAFNGYLPIDSKERDITIKSLEDKAIKDNQTQIFMETPFRNEKLFNALLNTLHPDTLLCIAKNITGKDEFIKSMPVKEWKNTLIETRKIPVIFLISNS